MNTRVNETTAKLKYNAEEIVLAVDMVEKLEKTVEVVNYLMEHENVESYVLLLMTAQNTDMCALLNDAKRDSDILFEINKDTSTYVMLCQDTRVDGGYHFAERIIKNIVTSGGTEIYCAEIEVRSTAHKVKTIIFKLIEMCIKAKLDKKSTQIVYKSLN